MPDERFAAVELEKGAVIGDGRSLLADASLPAAVIHARALAHNLGWMQRFAESHGASLAPHGKTTMAPALFQRQLDAGAWAITLATAIQCRAAFAHGIRRLLMANQLIGQANMTIVAELLEGGVEFACVVDGEANVRELGRFFAARGLTLDVLIELGVEGGRCGCRDDAQVTALADAIHGEPALQLIGLEGYEGVIAGPEPEAAIRAYAARLVNILGVLQAKGRFAVEWPIVTASGSAWYDLIAEAFEAGGQRLRVNPVLRPGCYVVHDHGLYADAQRDVLGRRPDLHAGLHPALEVFAPIQSLPEPGLAIVALGKRDIGHDALPVALRRYREGGRAEEELSTVGWEVVRLMDQHAFVHLPRQQVGAGDDAAVDNIRIGDIVAFGVSHPCLTFDKWRHLHVIDEALQIEETLGTYF
ncbi:amino acid deaminase [Halomonas shantousis]